MVMMTIYKVCANSIFGLRGNATSLRELRDYVSYAYAPRNYYYSLRHTCACILLTGVMIIIIFINDRDLLPRTSSSGCLIFTRAKKYKLHNTHIFFL